MNYLFHLFLSDPDPDAMLGNMMGDFVKGRLEKHDYPDRILFGLKQHRQVDSYANRDTACQRSRHRIDPMYGYFRPVMVDIFYDHLLARNWARHHEQSLEEFAATFYHHLKSRYDLLPTELKRIAPRMIQRNWLVSYRDIEIVETVLIRISQRIKRPNPLAKGFNQLQKNIAELEMDCDQFLVHAQEFLRQEKSCHSEQDDRK